MTESQAQECQAPGASDALAAATRLLSLKRQTRAQLGQKLRERGYAAAAIEAALSECERRNYLDDRLFAQLYVKSVLDRKAVGRMRLLHDLLRHGVDGAMAREVLDAVDDDEDARIERALAKLEATRPQDGYGQLGRRLERLGFTAPLIARALRRRAQTRARAGAAFEELR